MSEPVNESPATEEVETPREDTNPETGVTESSEGNAEEPIAGEELAPSGIETAPDTTGESATEEEREEEEKNPYSTDPQDIVDQARVHRATTLLHDAEVEVMSTGSPTAVKRLEDAQKELDTALSETGMGESRINYNTISTNFTPGVLTSQTGVPDVSGTTGQPDSANLVRSSNVFGHPLQRAVAQTAQLSAPDPNTVVVTLAQDPNAAREDVLRAAGVTPEGE